MTRIKEELVTKFVRYIFSEATFIQLVEESDIRDLKVASDGPIHLLFRESTYVQTVDINLDMNDKHQLVSERTVV
jgi:hypothetical protein